MQSPFINDGEVESKKRKYLLLISASKETAVAVKSALQRLKENVDQNADTLWVDSRGLGVCFSTEMVGYDIWEAVLKDSRVDFEAIKDVLIVELGKDWVARRDSKAEHWFSTHLGRPLPPPIRPRRGR